METMETRYVSYWCAVGKGKCWVLE